jgi:secreted Zn-dependent insulinase-like peptidase
MEHDMRRKITLDFCSDAARAATADFLLQLVKTGLTFEANQDNDTLVVTLTGGY